MALSVTKLSNLKNINLELTLMMLSSSEHIYNPSDEKDTEFKLIRLKKCNGGILIRPKKYNSCSAKLKNPGFKKNLINPLRIRSRCPTMYPESHIHNIPQTRSSFSCERNSLTLVR